MKENGVVFPVCGRGGGTGWETEEKKCKQDGNVWRKWMKVRTGKEGGEGERKPHGARSYVKDTVMSPPLLMTPTSVTLFCLLCLGRSSQRPPPPGTRAGASPDLVPVFFCVLMALHLPAPQSRSLTSDSASVLDQVCRRTEAHAAFKQMVPLG